MPVGIAIGVAVPDTVIKDATNTMMTSQCNVMSYTIAQPYTKRLMVTVKQL